VSGLESLERRLRLLEDEREILRTLYAYGYAIDYGNEDEFAECWTEDAVLHWGKTDERDLSQFPVRRLVGRDAILEAFRAHTHAPELFHKHVLLQPRIDVDGDGARVECSFERVDESPDGPVIRSFGVYRDELTRCADGRWRFSARFAEVENMVATRQAVRAP
jgi:hypothetical protein